MHMHSRQRRLARGSSDAGDGARWKHELRVKEISTRKRGAAALFRDMRTFSFAELCGVTICLKTFYRQLLKGAV